MATNTVTNAHAEGGSGLTLAEAIEATELAEADDTVIFAEGLVPDLYAEFAPGGPGDSNGTRITVKGVGLHDINRHDILI